MWLWLCVFVCVWDRVCVCVYMCVSMCMNETVFLLLCLCLWVFKWVCVSVSGCMYVSKNMCTNPITLLGWQGDTSHFSSLSLTSFLPPSTRNMITPNPFVPQIPHPKTRPRLRKPCDNLIPGDHCPDPALEMVGVEFEIPDKCSRCRGQTAEVKDHLLKRVHVWRLVQGCAMFYTLILKGNLNTCTWA